MMVGKRSVHSRAYARKSKKRIRFFLVAIFLIFFLFLLASWWVTNKSPLVLRGVGIEGAQHMPEEEVRRVAENILRRPLLLLWSRNNFLLAPRDRIEKALSEQFPWIDEVSVTVDGISRLRISIVEHVPEYIVCESQQDAACYFADKTGLVFAKMFGVERASYIIFHVSDSDELAGTRITSREEFQNINIFINGLTDNMIDVEEVTLLSTGETRITISFGADIIIDRKENTEEMLGNFLLLLTRETQARGTREAFLGNMEYVDVRYGNKVFYKAKE